MGLSLWCGSRALCMKTIPVTLRICGHRPVWPGADSSSRAGSTVPEMRQSCHVLPKNTRSQELLNKWTERRSLQRSKGWRPEKVPAWIISRRELSSALLMYKGSCQTIWQCHFSAQDPVQVQQEWSEKTGGFCCEDYTHWCPRMRALSVFWKCWSSELACPNRHIILLMTRTRIFYVLVLFFPTCQRKGFKHIIPASRK